MPKRRHWNCGKTEQKALKPKICYCTQTRVSVTLEGIGLPRQGLCWIIQARDYKYCVEGIFMQPLGEHITAALLARILSDEQIVELLSELIVEGGRELMLEIR